MEHKRAVYVCKSCDMNGIESSFKTAEETPALIEKSLASPSLLAYIMNQKFSCAMPLFRQEQELKRMGVKLPRQTMANQMLAVTEIFEPLYSLMRSRLLLEKILHADETPSQTNRVKGKSKPVKGYMWVYGTGKYSDIQKFFWATRTRRSLKIYCGCL